MSVGDVNSTDRGSAARYNDDKPHLELVPLSILAESFTLLPLSAQGRRAVIVLQCLGRFQCTGDSLHVTEAIRSMTYYWRDCAAVFDYGRNKYAEWNWAKGMAWSVALGSATRHALSIIDGVVNDEESGLPHMGHLMCNLVMLRQFADTYPEGNDLPNPKLFA